MEYFLILAFYVNGQVMFNTNLMPINFNTYQECEAMRVKVEPNLVNSAYPYHLACYKLETKGTDS